MPSPGPSPVRGRRFPAPGVHRTRWVAPVRDVDQLEHDTDLAVSNLSGGADSAAQTSLLPMTAAQIADLLQRLAGANHTLAAELESIGRSRRSLSQSTVDRLEHLVERMRPAARIRRQLSELAPQDLLAGARIWHQRQSAPLVGDR